MITKAVAFYKKLLSYLVKKEDDFATWKKENPDKWVFLKTGEHETHEEIARRAYESDLEQKAALAKLKQIDRDALFRKNE